MSDHKPRFLFVSHEASRTGAVIALLHLLRWLKEQNICHMTILLYRTGELEADFRKIGPVFIWQKENNEGVLITKITQKIQGKNHYQKKVLRQLSGQQFNLLYINSACAARIIPALKESIHCPVICHVHELESVMRTYCRADKFKLAVPYIDRYIAASTVVMENLVQRHDVPREKVQVVYEWISVESIRQPSKPKEAILQELGIVPDAFVVGGAGVAEWRKGVDLFILLAALVQKRQPERKICFVWVGYLDAISQVQISLELEKADLTSSVHFIGQKNNPADYYQLFDLFTLTSREDPFPLVCLEVAALAKPVFCFERAGGMPELIENGGGEVFSYLDVNAMSQRIWQLSTHNELVQKMGKILTNRVLQFDVSIAGERIWSILQETCELN